MKNEQDERERENEERRMEHDHHAAQDYYAEQDARQEDAVQTSQAAGSSPALSPQGLRKLAKRWQESAERRRTSADCSDDHVSDAHLNCALIYDACAEQLLEHLASVPSGSSPAPSSLPPNAEPSKVDSLAYQFATEHVTGHSHQPHEFERRAINQLTVTILAFYACARRVDPIPAASSVSAAGNHHKDLMGLSENIIVLPEKEHAICCVKGCRSNADVQGYCVPHHMGISAHIHTSPSSTESVSAAGLPTRLKCSWCRGSDSIMFHRWYGALFCDSCWDQCPPNPERAAEPSADAGLREQIERLKGVVDFHRGMAERFNESRDEFKHETRKLRAELAGLREHLITLAEKWRGFATIADDRGVETGRGSYEICAADLTALLTGAAK